MFRCEKPENAAAVAGKFLADLRQSIGTQPQDLEIAGRKIPVFVAPGGAAFVASVKGSDARIVGAAKVEDLSAGLAAHPDLAEGAAAAFPYPQYLDRFDHWGWGLYGLGGFDSTHNWMSQAGGVGQADPMEDLEWLARNKLRFEPWLDPLLCDTSDGIERNNGEDWMVREAAKRNLPVSFRVYDTSGEAEWTGRRFAQYFEQPASFLMSGWHGPEQFWKARRHFSWYQPEIHRYLAVKTTEMMKPYVAEPQVLGWMHPHGELVHDPWFDMHDDTSAAARASWQAYLKEKKVDPADLAQMFAREKPFASLAEAPIPEFATFAGLPGMILDLAGAWQYRVENPTSFAPDDAWWQQPVAERYPGIRDSWWDDAGNAKEWVAIDLPGSDEIFGIFRDGLAHNASTWFRREFVLPNKPDGKRVFLYAFPMSFGGIHSGDRARFHDAYVNGTKVGEFGAWGALDVTDALRPGENRLAVHLMGSLWNGRILLSTSEPKVFPYLGKDGNRLWLLWYDWRLDARTRAWSDILDGMRQIDANRPIKFMSPGGFGADRYLALARRWGGWPHFTGEGVWFFPWFKRYAYLYDLPATSELAGPCRNLDEQFNGYRRAFLAGLNGHEPVFIAQSYSRNPQLRRWREEHLPVLKRMGSYDLDGPQVLILRSSRTDVFDTPSPHPQLGVASREIQNPFNWDLGRGTLQTIWQSYLYLDEGGVADGKMRGYTLMVDCGNETLSADTIRHWWTYQQKMWHALDKPTIDFAPYRKGKWEDPTLDLRPGARFTQTAPNAKWTEPGFDDKGWTTCELGALHLQGGTAGKPAYVRKRFEVPAKWLGSGTIYLTSGAWAGPQYLDPARMLLNGRQIHDFATDGFWETDVTKFLHKGANVVTFEFKGERKLLGFAGNVWLYWRRAAVGSMDLAGEWQGTDREGKAIKAQFPGTATAKTPTRTIKIPADWKGKYRVRLYLEGERSRVLGAWVDGRMVRRHHHGFGERCDVDITDFLKLGAANEIILAQGNDWQGVDLRPGEAPNWNLRVLRLDLFP